MFPLSRKCNVDQRFAAGARSQYPGVVIFYRFTMPIPNLLLVVVGPWTRRAYLPAVVGIAERTCGKHKSSCIAVIGYLLFDSTLLWVLKYSGGLFVGLLLETALVVLDVTCCCMYEVRVEKREHRDTYQ